LRYQSRICRPLLKVRSTDIRTGNAPEPLHGFRRLFPAWGEGLSFFTGGSPEVEDGTDSNVGPGGTPST